MAERQGDGEADPDDGVGWDDSPLAGEKVVGWVANLAGGALLAADSTGLALLSVNAIEKLASAAFALDKRAYEARQVRRVQVIQGAVERMGVEVDEFMEKAGESDARMELVGRVLEAASTTVTLKSKIDGLSRVLASGLSDDAKVDEAVLLAGCLGGARSHARSYPCLSCEPAAPVVGWRSCVY